MGGMRISKITSDIFINNGGEFLSPAYDLHVWFCILTNFDSVMILIEQHKDFHVFCAYVCIQDPSQVW